MNNTIQRDYSTSKIYTHSRHSHVLTKAYQDNVITEKEFNDIALAANMYLSGRNYKNRENISESEFKASSKIHAYQLKSDMIELDSLVSKMLADFFKINRYSVCKYYIHDESKWNEDGGWSLKVYYFINDIERLVNIELLPEKISIQILN